MGVQLPTVEKILNRISGSFGGVKGVYQKRASSSHSPAPRPISII
jgi:hypothetical protein